TLLPFLLRHADFRHTHRRQSDLGAEHIRLLLVQLTPAPHRHLRAEEHRPEPYPLETVDPHALGFPHASHLAVATFQQTDVEPAVDTLAAGTDDVGEARRAVLEHDALLEPLDHFFVHLAHHADRVLAVHLPGRVHQPVRQ